MRVTVICENSVYGKIGALAEHGWSAWIETDGGSYLFDTGQGLSLRSNAEQLNIPLDSADGILISHHHSDHTGGLQAALNAQGSAKRRDIPVYAHPDLFKESFGKPDHRPMRYFGIPHSRSALEVWGADFRLETGWREISPGLSMTGEVPRRTSFELGDDTILHYGPSGELEVDSIRDDQTVVIDTPEGLVVVLGCSHAGLINILTYIVERTGKRRFHTVMGGTHLGPVSEEQIAGTIEALREFDIGRLGTSHCTGPVVAARLAAEYGERFFFSSVGTTIEV